MSAYDLAVTGSTLSPDQDAVALQCVRESVRGTSFPLDATDTDAQNSAALRRSSVGGHRRGGPLDWSSDGRWSLCGSTATDEGRAPDVLFRHT